MPAHRKTHNLDQQQFERLLSWLDVDREQAGLIYEKIRGRLVTILAARGCVTPEELADETIDRVARRVIDIQADYSGDKLLYFLGVANNVHHEFLKRPTPAVTEDLPANDADQELVHNCLELCLDQLAGDSRQILLDYYSLDKQSKIDLRKQMAEQLGISLNTLRLRVLRMKERLQPCIERCMNRRKVF